MDISVEPDAYVMGLASDLVRFEATTSQWLPYKEYHQVMDNLKITLCTILIEDFRHIRSLDTSGCFKLNANVRALEQVLAIITTGGSSLNATDRSPNLSSVSENNPISISARGCDLQAAKDYYKLASVGVDHLIETIPQLRNRFTTHQYQAVFDVLYRGLDAQQGLDDEGANTLRTAYQNQLVRLKYLIEDSSS